MRKEYPVKLLCKILQVSKSGYYAYLKRAKKPTSQEDRKLLTRIKRICTLHEGTWGAKRIAKALSAKGSAVNHKRVERLMRETNLKARVRLPKTSAESKVESAGFVYENHLNRDFEAQFPNTKWVTDMTEIMLEGQKVYISALKDLFNGEIIAFETSSSPNQELICRTIRSAQQNRRLKTLEGVLIHSDQGSVYRSLSYHELSSELKFTPSMSRKANCWDNAVIESFFSHMKVEYPLFYLDMTLETCRKDLLSYIRYYNERRIQKKLGYVAPKTYLKKFKQAA